VREDFDDDSVIDEGSPFTVTVSALEVTGL
jgi:hypothetical protein